MGHIDSLGTLAQGLDPAPFWQGRGKGISPLEVETQPSIEVPPLPSPVLITPRGGVELKKKKILERATQEQLVTTA